MNWRGLYKFKSQITQKISNNKSPETHRESVDGLYERHVGSDIPLVVADIYKHLKEARREQAFEETPVTLLAEQETQRAERVGLEEERK